MRPYTFSDDALKKALTEGKSVADIAKEFEVNPRTISRRKAKLVATGFDPENDRYYNNPDSQLVKGYSTLVRHKDKEDGSTGTVMEWVKTSRTIDTLMEMFNEHVKEKTTPIPLNDLPQFDKPDLNTDVIPWFNIGDAHLGMVAYDKEVGHDFDLEIAERELCAAMGWHIERNEGYERCVIQDMGDMTHYENFSAKTEASGHDLDYDTRYPKMIKAYRRTMEWIVKKALTHFKYVDVIINQGNHSRTNDIWMAVHLDAMFKETERVTVLNNECIFIPYRMGNTFVMCHHSDKCRPKNLGDVMVTDFRQDYGETEYHYIDIGHIHHHMVSKEHAGVKIESFNQLATMDRYAHDAGYRSRSCLTVVRRSKTYGEVGRDTLTLEEVRDRLYKTKAGFHANIRRKVHTI